MLEVVILAFLFNGCISADVEEYNPSWKDVFDGIRSNDLFPEINAYRADMYMDVLVEMKGSKGLQFTLQLLYESGSLIGRFFRFSTPDGVDITLTSILLQFFDPNRCNLILTFQSEEEHSVEWKVTSPVYTPPPTKSDAQTHATSFAVKPKNFGIEVIQSITRQNRNTIIDAKWVERIIGGEPPRCVGGPLKKECAGVAVIMAKKTLRAYRTKMNELYD